MLNFPGSGDNISSFPWKYDRSDEPVVYTEETEEMQIEEKGAGGGVKFQVGIVEDDEDEDEEEHFREKGHRQNRHKKKSSRQEKSMTERKMSEDYVNLADESGHLQEVDLEEIAGHRFEKAKVSAPKYSHKKQSLIKIGAEDVKQIGRDIRMLNTLGYGFNEELDHTPHALFIEMDELEGDEWEERARCGHLSTRTV